MTPDAVLSQAPPPPAALPPPGTGQVVLEVTNGRAEVGQVVGRYQVVTMSRYGTSVTPGEITNTICTTPCTATLPFGTSDLRFTSVDDEDHTSTGQVTVGPAPTAYRHTLGISRPRGGLRVLAITLITLGLSSLLTGALFSALDDGTSSSIGLSPTPWYVAGVIGMGAGIGLTIAFPSEHQQGSGVQFALPTVGGGRTLAPGEPPISR